MIRMFITLCCFVLSFNMTIISATAAECDLPTKTAIVYTNGMLSTFDEAYDSAHLVLAGVMDDYILQTGSNLDVEYYLAYVRGEGWLDFLQVLQDKLYEDYSALWRFSRGIAVEAIDQPLRDALQVAFEALPSWSRGILYKNRPDFLETMYGRVNGLTGALEFPGLVSLLNNQKKVMIVSHSQGNFYANALYEELTMINPLWSSSIGNVAVATPAGSVLASKVGNNEPYITVPEDKVIQLVRGLNLTVNTLPAKSDITQPFLGTPAYSSNYNELGGLSVWLDANGGHSFVTWYLTGTYTRDFILQNTVAEIGRLTYPVENKVPLMVSTGAIRVAPSPDGSIYVSRAVGVFRVDSDGTETFVPGIPRVDFIDSANNFYYSDGVLATSANNNYVLDVRPRTNSNMIIKRDPNGNESVVHYGNQGASIYSYDVAADGTVYILDKSPLPDSYSVLYKVKDGVTSHIAGALPILVRSSLQNGLNSGYPLSETFFPNLESVYDAGNGMIFMATIGVNSVGGPYGYMSPGGIFPPSFMGFDYCSNGKVKQTTGVSAALSQDEKTLYFVDRFTSDVMKMGGQLQ